MMKPEMQLSVNSNYSKGSSSNLGFNTTKKKSTLKFPSLTNIVSSATNS